LDDLRIWRFALAKAAVHEAKIAKVRGVCKVAGEVVSEAEVMFRVVEG
jgi:hypothetical protein